MVQQDVSSESVLAGAFELQIGESSKVLKSPHPRKVPGRNAGKFAAI
jgi:hypothetical protein